MHCHNPGFSLLIENHGRLFWTATRDLPLQSSSCTAQLLYLGGWENFRSHDVSAKTHWWKCYKPYQMELHSVTAADDKGSQKISLFLCLPHWKGGALLPTHTPLLLPHPLGGFALSFPKWRGFESPFLLRKPSLLPIPASQAPMPSSTLVRWLIDLLLFIWNGFKYSSKPALESSASFLS